MNRNRLLDSSGSFLKQSGPRVAMWTISVDVILAASIFVALIRSSARPVMSRGGGRHRNLGAKILCKDFPARATNRVDEATT